MVLHGRLLAFVAILVLLAVPGCGDGDSTGGGATNRTSPPTKAAPPPKTDEETEPLVQAPNVIDMEGQAAVGAIEEVGLTATHDELDPAGCTVEDQDETGEVPPDTEVVLDLDCRQRDWENREGDEWETFGSSFASAAEEGCSALFNLSPDGSLYDDDGDEFSVTDCSLATESDPESADVTIPDEVPEDPDQLGRTLGFEHGCEALFDREFITELHHGDLTVTAEDCLPAAE